MMSLRASMPKSRATHAGVARSQSQKRPQTNCEKHIAVGEEHVFEVELDEQNRIGGHSGSHPLHRSSSSQNGTARRDSNQKLQDVCSLDRRRKTQCDMRANSMICEPEHAEKESNNRTISAPIACRPRKPLQDSTTDSILSQFGPEEILDALAEETGANSSSWP